MEPDYAKNWLKRLAKEKGFNKGYDEAVVRAYRRRIAFIIGAPDERALRGMRSLRLEKLKGARSYQHSVRLNDQWRLIIEFRERKGKKVIRVVGIEDYHK